MSGSPVMTSRTFNIDAIRSIFPSLNHQIHGQSLIYLDNAATAQKPQPVIDCISNYYSAAAANVHRGSHALTTSITNRFETARNTVAQFLGAKNNCIVWTRGATEALNLIAQSYGRQTLKPNDEILISEMEHHANIVPWQLIAEQTGARIVKWPINTVTCTLDMTVYEELLNEHTKIVCINHVSNVTGTRNPIEVIIKKAHAIASIVVIDGAQAIVHEPVDVIALNADFYVFSGHKMFGPTGIGILYGKEELLDTMPPWHGGGNMIKQVTFKETQFAESPAKFEAGTPHVAGALALSEAITWLNTLDRQKAAIHIATLQSQLIEGIKNINNLSIIGLQIGASVIAFTVNNACHSDIAILLDQQGVAVRSGHHCAHPLMDALGITGCVRVSIALYNTSDDIACCITAIQKACELV